MHVEPPDRCVSIGPLAASEEQQNMPAAAPAVAIVVRGGFDLWMRRV